ncbi:hypothetical protein V4C53_30120 [Paraburkholderia azotifigens]|uniref:hypothetical protein n=1 Tax=Paraburkholderia azotifigens TaxID=2057004 RepID=UPI00317BAFA3
MTTTTRSNKIPQNPRVSKSAKDGANGFGAQRQPTVKPGGERFQTKYAGAAKQIVNHLTVIGNGIDALLTARQVAAETGDAELAALANNPAIVKALDKALKKLAKDTTQLVECDPLVQAGMDAMDALVGNTNVTLMDAAYCQRIEAARKRAFDMMGANNPARIAAGLPDEPRVGDDVYAGLGRKGARQGEYEGK